MQSNSMQLNESRANFAAQLLEPQWFAAQTRSRHEKAVAEHLCRRNIENFLPLYERVSRWKDRRVRLQLPLFDGYIFVRIAVRERLRALETPGIARLVSFGGLPNALPDEEIETLRGHLENGIQVMPHPYLAIGQRVSIRGGPLAGWTGILVRQKSQYRLVVSVDLIQRSIAADVDVSDVEPIAEHARPAHLASANLNAASAMWAVKEAR
jgi:transcription antitermination factor NusG